jgi:hypothetical protein
VQEVIFMQDSSIVSIIVIILLFVLWRIIALLCVTLRIIAFITFSIVEGLFTSEKWKLNITYRMSNIYVKHVTRNLDMKSTLFSLLQSIIKSVVNIRIFTSCDYIFFMKLRCMLSFSLKIYTLSQRKLLHTSNPTPSKTSCLTTPLIRELARYIWIFSMFKIEFGVESLLHSQI